MIDLHVHILPGVDDGALDLSVSLAMAETAASCGVEVLAATPHSNQTGAAEVLGGFRNYESEELQERFSELSKAVRKEKIPVHLVRGMEIMGVGPLRERIQKGLLIPLNQSRFYLIEVPFNLSPENIRECLSVILRMGKIPILAHPERYYCVQDDPELLLDWKAQGALFQVDQGSMIGRFGRRGEQTAEWILTHRLAVCVASDAHDAEERSTDLRPAGRILEHFFSGEYRDLLLELNPQRILFQLGNVTEPVPVWDRKSIWCW